MNLVFSADGQRKYLTTNERLKILRTAAQQEPMLYSLCLTLSVTGCRISEALALTAANVDATAPCIVIESLKKRSRGVFRTVPVPSMLVSLLDEIHDLEACMPGERLWPWSRMTAWRRINAVMATAGVTGDQASAKGFRHGFGVAAIQSGVPLNMVQKWLGHTDMRTTSIYTCAIGPEEKSIAARMWDQHLDIHTDS